MIEDRRKKHIWAVADLMKKYGQERGLSQADCEDLYILGLLHDIGYAFSKKEDYCYHNRTGGAILQRQGYKYWQEVYYHGFANSPYQSEFLDLLNLADMHIDNKGNYVSLDDRLEDISKRYNVPVKELESYKVVQELKNKGFN